MKVASDVAASFLNALLAPMPIPYGEAESSTDLAVIEAAGEEILQSKRSAVLILHLRHAPNVNQF